MASFLERGYTSDPDTGQDNMRSKARFWQPETK